MNEQTSLELYREVQKLNPSSIVELYELDASSLGVEGVLRFHNGTNGMREPVTFAGEIYNALPIEVKGFDVSNSGEPPRPSLRIMNFGGFLSDFLLETNDLVGATVTRRRTFARYLGRAASVTVEFPPDVFIVEQKVKENRQLIEFELGTGLDLDGTKFPGRQVASGYCTFDYRGDGCGFSDSRVVCDPSGNWFEGAQYWKGEYSSDGTYDTGESVGHNDGTYYGIYVSLEDGVTQSPTDDPSKWRRVQRYRGEYDRDSTILVGATTYSTYEKGDVVYLENSNGYRVLFYAYATGAGTYVPSYENGGAPTTQTYWKSDRCAKFLAHCMLRFDPWDRNLSLPFGGFPGTLNLPEI